MELLTTTEMAKKWGLSRRRVTTYCTNGRIEGAIMKGNTWLIPDNAISLKITGVQEKIVMR